jgi:hypothetical protein
MPLDPRRSGVPVAVALFRAADAIACSIFLAAQIGDKDASGRHVFLGKTIDNNNLLI